MPYPIVCKSNHYLYIANIAHFNSVSYSDRQVQWGEMKRHDTAETKVNGTCNVDEGLVHEIYIRCVFIRNKESFVNCLFKGFNRQNNA